MIFLIVVINVVTFCVYALDKNRAQKSEFRISERTLLLLAALGGALGAYLGMNIFRHKTQHAKFKIFVPAMLVVQVVVLMYFAFC
jgi:uncharacterized membrane protein YsdA (DUF1294 family)